MKKLFCVIFALALCAGLMISVSAQTAAPTAKADITVSADGSAHVTVVMSLTVTSPQEELYFAVPSDAGGITVNGAGASVHSQSGAQRVSLSHIGSMAGTHSVTVSYTVPGVVQREDDKTYLRLPLLSGNPFAIEQLQFTLRLPGAMEYKPGFVSNIHPDTIGEFVKVQTKGPVITGTVNTAMKDQETLALEMQADPGLFPQAVATSRVLGTLDVMAVVMAALAVAYFLITMRPGAKRPPRRATVPDSMTAGEVERWLVGGGVDLSLLVLSWAQMGYIHIQVERGGRILLYKRMEMENERSVFEAQVYRALFGSRNRVDGTSGHYAKLCREVAQQTGRPKEVYHRRSGNPLILQCCSVISAALVGATVGGAYLPHSIGMRIFVGLVMGLLSVVIHYGMEKLFLRRRQALWLAMAAAGVWLVLSIFAGKWGFALVGVLFQLASGIAAGYGGRRSELGKNAALQLQGLRAFMRTASREELVRLLKTNPDYYYMLAPYALGMNIDRAFARRFGRQRLPVCPFLTDARTQRLTAWEFNELLRYTVKTLDEKAQRLNLEKLLKRS